MQRLIVRASICIAFGLGFFACRQLVGIHDEPILHDVDAGSLDDASVSACALSTGAPACRSCLAGSCCAQVAACNANSGCKKSFDCVLACGAADEACRAACVQDLDATLADALSCRGSTCAVPCEASCGGIVGATNRDVSAVSADCMPCATSRACSELTACAADPKCIASLACTGRTCGYLDRACGTKCQVAVGPGANSASLAVSTALGGRCRDECRLGSDWSCVGKRSWPVGAAGPVTFDFNVVDAVTHTPMKDAQVRTCSSSVGDCNPPLDVARTADNGHVHLNALLTAPRGVFNGYLELTGSNAYPTLVFFFPPLAGSLVGDATYSPYTYELVSTDVWSFVSSQIPVAIDPSRGFVFAVVLDCVRSPGSGLVFEVTPSDASTYVGYVSNGLFDKSATATDASGQVGFANVSPGTVTVSARLASTNQVVSRSTVVVRAGTLTSALMAASPPE